MLETYTVLRIDEPDFGCEGRPEGMEPVDRVLLKKGSNGEEIFVKERDALLYEMDINEGDEVFLVEGELKKIR
nr:hypothetical protein [uncultured Blautia sp.]